MPFTSLPSLLASSTVILFCLLAALLPQHQCHAFVLVPKQPNPLILPRSCVLEAVPNSDNGDNNDTTESLMSSSSVWDGIQQDWNMRYRILQESQSKGYNFKQTVANVMAGTYDTVLIQDKINELITSAPCVMFTWEPSPSCIQAKKAMDLMGITDQVLEIPLDKPWSEGNPIRAELGKMVGRSSVPAIFIGGQYVGGFDGGISKDDAPGIQAMAFQGTLRPALEAAGIAFPKKS